MLDFNTIRVKNLRLAHHDISFFSNFFFIFHPSLSYHSLSQRKDTLFGATKLGLHQVYAALLGGTSSQSVVPLFQGHLGVLSGLLR